MEAERVTIYALIDPRTDEVRYIGRSGNPVQRLGSHLAGSGSGAYQVWMRGLRACGQKPLLRELERVNAAAADRAERLTIARHLAQGCALTNDLCSFPMRVPEDKRLSVGGTVDGALYNGVVEVARVEGCSLGKAVALLLREALSARERGNVGGEVVRVVR